MQLVPVTGLDSTEKLASYKVRDSVTAALCEDGVTVTDDAGSHISSWIGPCYLIVNPEPDGGFQSQGDRFDIVPADTFKALFTFDSEVEPNRPEQVQIRDDGPLLAGIGQPNIVHNADGSVTIDGVTYNPAGGAQGAQGAPGL